MRGELSPLYFLKDKYLHINKYMILLEFNVLKVSLKSNFKNIFIKNAAQE